MNSYLGRAIFLYVVLSLLLLLALIPIYLAIESRQETKLDRLLMPRCSTCDFHYQYQEQEPGEFENRLVQRQRKSNLRFFIGKSASDTPPPWVTELNQEIASAWSQLTATDLYRTVQVLPDKGTKLSIVYLEPTSFLIIEEYLSVSKAPIDINTDKLAAELKKSLQVSLIISVILVFIFLILTLYFARKIFNKLNLINTLTDEVIKTGDLAKRLPCEGENNEFDLLAKQLNLLLETIENKVFDIKNISNLLAHELRTPLTHLSHQIENLSVPYEQHKQIKKSMRRAISTFDAILRISHLETGNAQVNKKQEDLIPIIEDAIELFAPLAEEKQQFLTCKLAHVNLKVDKNLLSQAVINLLDNAIKYAPEKAEVSITMNNSQSMTQIIVENSNTFVAPEQLEKLTNRFVRGEKITENEGLGLGLTLVDAIASAHLGNLKLESENFRFKASLHLPSN